MKKWLVIGLLVCFAAMFSLGCGEEQKQPDKKEVIPSKDDLKKAINKPEEKKEEIKSEEKKEETKGDEGKKEEGKKEETKKDTKQGIRRGELTNSLWKSTKIGFLPNHYLVKAN